MSWFWYGNDRQVYMKTGSAILHSDQLIQAARKLAMVACQFRPIWDGQNCEKLTIKYHRMFYSAQ